MENTLQNTLVKYAKQDLAIARKNGVVCITDTKEGNIEVEYISERKMFIITKLNGPTIAVLKSKEAVLKIADLYQVEAA